MEICGIERAHHPQPPLETKTQKGTQSKAAVSNSCSRFLFSCKLPNKNSTKTKNRILIHCYPKINYFKWKSYEPAVRREKRTRSPSLISSKTLHPSQVILGFWFRLEVSFELSIVICYLSSLLRSISTVRGNQFVSGQEGRRCGNRILKP